MSSVWRFLVAVFGGTTLLIASLLLGGCTGISSSGEIGSVGGGGPGTLTHESSGDHSAYLSPDIIRVGDKLTVRLTDIPNPPDPIEVRVREDGTISLILGVQVQAAGKKAGELEAEIQRKYVPAYFQRLTVNVKCEERVFYVDGEVRKPDRYIYTGEM
ncbi:MAG: polysaccharide biosynthesis/export family protein, partial [Verrucomicrobiae bacterium]|nr:polysaccharide biosynthesis/export family protein [Verrucomicrobiae bacterium]